MIVAEVDQLGHCVVQSLREVVKHRDLRTLDVQELGLEMDGLGTIGAAIRRCRSVVIKWSLDVRRGTSICVV